MTDVQKIKLVHAVSVGAIVAVVFVTLLTIAGDLYAPLKTFLKDAHHHHWIGKGVWAGALFVLATALCYVPAAIHSSPEALARRLSALSWTLVVSSIVLFLFFIYEYFR